MKLLHTSDWHFGMNFRGIDVTEDQRYFIDQIREIIQKEKADAVAIAGDIFDRGIPSVDAIRLYDETMNMFCNELKVPVVIIAGNHDGAERLSMCHSILQHSGLHIAGSLERNVCKVSVSDTDIYLLPWFNTDKVRAVYQKTPEEIKDLSDAYSFVLDNIRADFDPDRKHVLVSHAYIVQAETSTSDRAAEIGTAAAVEADLFSGFDYVALGHIHKPQDVAENIRYSGTPMPYSFGKEETQEKSVTLVDTATGEKKIIPLKLLHQRKTLRGKYETLLAADFPEDILSGYIRLEVEDVAVGLEMRGMLKERYTNLLEVFGKEYDTDTAGITMTREELEQEENDPELIFKHFCKDVMNETPSSHQLDLLRQVIAEYTEEIEE